MNLDWGRGMIILKRSTIEKDFWKVLELKKILNKFNDDAIVRAHGFIKSHLTITEAVDTAEKST